MMDLRTRNTTTRLVVFTALNGALLDEETYSFSPANAALESLQRHNIPIILCSTKTRVEVELIQLDLRVRHPFISESGGAIFLPRNYFPFVPDGMRSTEGLDVIDCRTPRWRLVKILHQMADEFGIRVCGFSEMSVEEVAENCRLNSGDAHLAKMREYDEAFRILNSNPTSEDRLLTALHDAGLCCTKEDLYYRLTSGTDEGKAVMTLRSLYARAWGDVLTIGLGDRLTDLALLRRVDLPIVVCNPAVGDTAKILGQVPKARVSAAPGPVGWNQVVLEMARKYCEDRKM